MRYLASHVKESGARFELVEGSARELYDEITCKLESFYKSQNSSLEVPSSPQFEKFVYGTVRLSPITFKKEEGNPALNHGSINVSYFKGRPSSAVKKSRSKREIDYPSYISAPRPYESITLFFNTLPANIDKDDLRWANETQRDNFLAPLEYRL